MFNVDDWRQMKDLLESTVLASEERIKKELRAEIQASEERLEAQIGDLAKDVGEALSVTNDTIEDTAQKAVKKHELRFHSLQPKAA
jgi:molybdenum-dependent DNA-binding transcriptional regulator ModE